MRLCALFCWSLGSLPALGFLTLAWILRDGLGPDSVPTDGPAALRRFLGTVADTRFWGLAGMPVLAFGLPMVVGGCLLWHASAGADGRTEGLSE